MPMRGYFITGTDTGVGKTVAAAWMMLHTGADYWKPVQSGLEERDVDTVKALTRAEEARFHPSTYELKEPLSPHEAARREGVQIALSDFTLPKSEKKLIVEGAGGLMVPINEEEYIIDLIKKLMLPVILVARSSLGTINHTLLSLSMLQGRNIPVAGVVISGEKTPHNRLALEEYGRVPVIAELDCGGAPSKDVLLKIKPEVDWL